MTKLDRPIVDYLAPAPGGRLVVTGGCGGIGRILVSRAVSLSLDVTVIDLPAAIAAHPRSDVCMIGADATDDTAIADAFFKIAAVHGAIDYLVHLTGFSNTPARVGEGPLKAFDETIAGNLRSSYIVCQSALPLLQSSPSASLVLTSSGLAMRPAPGFSPYSAAKAGVIALMRSIALEYAPLVRANVVAPGAVRTTFLTGGEARPSRPGPTVDEKAAAYAQSIPMGRIAEPEDVADPILFLLGPGSRFITGQVLHINGGGLMP